MSQYTELSQYLKTFQHFLATELLTCGITCHKMQLISPH